MPLVLNAKQKPAIEEQTKCCLILGGSGTGKTVLLTEKARYLHEVRGVPYSEIAVIYPSERDAAIARNSLLENFANDSNVKPNDLRYFGTFLSVSYEIIRNNLRAPCLSLFNKGFTIMDSEQEFDIAMELMKHNKDYGIFKNNLRIKISKALHGIFSGCEQENVGLQRLHDDFKKYLSDNRIIVREKLPEWCIYIGQQADTKLPKYVLIDNVHRLNTSEWNMAKMFLERCEETTFTTDEYFSECCFRDETEDNQDYVSLLKDKYQAKVHILEHNYRKSQAPLVYANVLATSKEVENNSTIQGSININAYNDCRETAVNIAKQIQELRIRGANYSEIGILYADGFMQKNFASVFKEQNIPFESGFGDFLGSCTSATWLIRVLKFSLNPLNPTSAGDAIFDRNFGDLSPRRFENHYADSFYTEADFQSSKLYVLMRNFIAVALKNPNADTSWVAEYFNLDERLKKQRDNYENNVKYISSVLETIDAIHKHNKRSILQAIAQFLSNYNVRGRYALIRPYFPNCVHITHYKVDIPYNFPFLFITDCNDGKISLIDGCDLEQKRDRYYLYTAVKRCSFELHMSYMRKHKAKNGVIHQVKPSPLLKLIPNAIRTGDENAIKSLDECSCDQEKQEIISYEDFMKCFDEEQLKIIKDTSSQVSFLKAPVGTGKTQLLLAKVLYLHHEHGVPFREMFVTFFSKQAVNKFIQKIMSIDGNQNLNTIFDFPYFCTFEALCVKLLNKKLRISDYGYGRGFKIQKEEAEFRGALRILGDLIPEIEEAELRATANNFLKVYYHELYEDCYKKIYSIQHESFFDPMFAKCSSECTEQVLKTLNFEDDIKIYQQCDIQTANLTSEDISSVVNNEIYRQFHDQFLRFKKDNNFMSMCDARNLAVKLVSNISSQAKWIFIDEFQDSDPLQLVFFSNLLSENSKMFVVGDPAQNLYEWQCNPNRNFDYLKHQYNAVSYELTKNYRNSEDIINCARIFNEGGNSHNQFYRALEQVKDVCLVKVSSVDEEANYVATRIEELHEAGVCYTQMAVFFRCSMNAQKIMPRVLLNRNIPVNIWLNPNFRTQKSGCEFSVSEISDENGVSLLSLHRSKGLEFKYVFIIDCNGVVVNDDKFKSEDNERNLYYVGMTRAREGLEIIYLVNELNQEQEIIKDIPAQTLEGDCGE